jgi:hypothetical protein
MECTLNVIGRIFDFTETLAGRFKLFIEQYNLYQFLDIIQNTVG